MEEDRASLERLIWTGFSPIGACRSMNALFVMGYAGCTEMVSFGLSRPSTSATVRYSISSSEVGRWLGRGGILWAHGNKAGSADRLQMNYGSVIPAIGKKQPKKGSKPSTDYPVDDL